MKDLTFSQAYGNDFIEMWSDMALAVKKPVISAVNGYALGGGCELAMMADILYCSAGATFGQPEIKLGIIPGAGGSQRLTAAIGKSKAMELILTGNNFSGKEAGEWGLAAKVFETPQECVDGAIATASKIASYSRIAVKAAKEVVNKSQDVGIREGVEFERRVFHGLFGSRDQKIGTLGRVCCTSLFTNFARYGCICRKEEAGVVARVNKAIRSRTISLHSNMYIKVGNGHIRRIELDLDLHIQREFMRQHHSSYHATTISTTSRSVQVYNKPRNLHEIDGQDNILRAIWGTSAMTSA